MTCGLELMLHKEKELIAVQIGRQVNALLLRPPISPTSVGVRLKICLGNLSGLPRCCQVMPASRTKPQRNAIVFRKE